MIPSQMSSEKQLIPTHKYSFGNRKTRPGSASVNLIFLSHLDVCRTRHLIALLENFRQGSLFRGSWFIHRVRSRLIHETSLHGFMAAFVACQIEIQMNVSVLCGLVLYLYRGEQSKLQL